ncbi:MULTISPECIES: hypothetical protein [Streptomyces]|uniref:Toxin-antitoxin system HicB family antitoxin n=2 Tax=Streptomyces TaxID=1883 RepID=A0A3Q9FZF9_STRLT|nr:hypothetical protein [Streptomyces luteoverticillatus]AZQ72115.1 hypothetical protein EKH77_13630 [Streptomyces luteoverticillatus]
MAKTQVNLRLEESTAEMAKQAAETRHIPVNEYVEQLIRADNEELREKFLAGVQEVLDGYGDLIDEIEAAAA